MLRKPADQSGVLASYHKNGRMNYPFSEMKRGDSIFLIGHDGNSIHNRRLQTNVITAAANWVRRNNLDRKFRTTVILGGVHCQRVK